MKIGTVCRINSILSKNKVYSGKTNILDDYKYKYGIYLGKSFRHDVEYTDSDSYDVRKTTQHRVKIFQPLIFNKDGSVDNRYRQNVACLENYSAPVDMYNSFLKSKGNTIIVDTKYKSYYSQNNKIVKEIHITPVEVIILGKSKLYSGNSEYSTDEYGYVDGRPFFNQVNLHPTIVVMPIDKFGRFRKSFHIPENTYV